MASIIGAAAYIRRKNREVHNSSNDSHKYLNNNLKREVVNDDLYKCIGE